jgi:hypothetical protein
MVVNQAKLFALKLLEEAEPNPTSRLYWAFGHALQRKPTQDQQQKSIELIESIRKALASEGSEDDAQIGAWATLCQALMASNEFRYLD